MLTFAQIINISFNLILSKFAAELLGFTNFIPPFSIASFNDSIKGVNFASGAAGIRDDSGRFLVQISLIFSFTPIC